MEAIMQNRRIQELAKNFVRLKQASGDNDMSLDPRPALPPPEPKERPVKKRARRVFPFIRRKDKN